MKERHNDNFIWDTLDLEEDELDANSLLEEDDFAKLLDEDYDQSDEAIKELEKEFRKNNFQRNRRRIRLTVMAIIVLVIGSIFVPLIKVNQISYNQTYFIDPTTITKANIISEGQRVSIWDLIQMEFKLRSATGLDLNANFDWQHGNLAIKVNEEIPLAKYNDEVYYKVDNKIRKSRDFKYQAPMLIGFDQAQADSIISQLSTLDYGVLKEIGSINLQASNEEPNLVVMSMNDGSYVFIHIDQISEKMPYYLQLASIVKEVKGPNSKGIYHLNYGDYYEQI